MPTGTVDQNQKARPLFALLEEFYDYDGAGKETVLAAFRHAADKDVFPLLDQALRNDEKDRLRNAAMEIYVALHSRSLPFLVSLLEDGNEQVRTFAGVMLSTLKLSGSVPALIKALVDPDMNVKHAAAEALGKIGDRRAVEPLICALSTDMWLQFPAAIALGEIGDHRAVEPLMALLAMPGANIPAIQALGKLAHPAALGRLAAFLEDEELSLVEWALEAVVETITRNASLALPPLPAKARTNLIELLDPDRPAICKSAVIALGSFKVADAIPHLSRLLRDSELAESARMSLATIQAS